MYFSNIRSFAELKKQYRELAKKNHPDLGGSDDVMKAINAEFEKLYEVWKDREEVTGSDESYANDYSSATAREYTSYVYNEYKWAGDNYKKYHEYDNKKICEHVREFLKSTYPHCTFSVNKSGYNSVNVYLMKADFYPYKDHSKLRGNINHYHIDSDNELTDRCKEVFSNVIAYVESWNYDDSDIMTDYFSVNFYSNFRIGGNGKNFIYQPISLGSEAPKFTRRVTPTQARINKACGQGNAFHYRYKYKDGERVYLTEQPKVLCRDDDDHYELWYSQPSLLKKRMVELIKAGVLVKPSGKTIELIGYLPETLAALEREKEEEDERERKFYERQARPSTTLAEKCEPINAEGINLVDYSEKAVAVTGSTKDIADLLKKLGGRFNPRLSCGAGWIFSKKKETELREALGL